MNSLTDYIHESYNNDYYNIVLEKLDNNERIINEENLLLEHGKDIDNILYKFNSYVKQNLYNNINESNISYKLTVSEQQTVRDLFIYVCEDYKRALEDECNIYEKLLSEDESLLNEDFKLADNIKTIWQAGKDKVNQAVENAKVSIKELNELIKQFASKAIKTIKDIAEKIIELVEKLKSSLFEIAKKIGFNDERIKKIQDELAEDLQNNTDKITKANVYESYSDDIKLVNEGIVDAVNNSKVVKWYKDKKQKPLWNAFFQFANWGIVCVILPGFIVAMFPGAQVALLLIMVIKIAWQWKKFKKLKKQISDAYHNWGTYTKSEKFWTGLTLGLGIGCTIYNLVTLVGDFSALASKITEDFWNEGISGLLKSNDLGMKPDNLTLAAASVFKMVKEGKFSLDALADAKKELIDAFTKQDIKFSTEKIKRVFSNDIKDLLIKKFEKYTGHSSTELVNIIKKTAKAAGFDISNVSEKANYTVYLDGQLKGSDWGKKVLALMKEMGVKEQIDNSFNKTLETINSNAGSGSFVVLPGKLIKAALKQGLEFGANNHHAIVGETFEAISTITTKTVTSVAQALSVTAPVITLTPKHAGFIVRLGGEGTENYTYKVVKKNGIITGEYGKVLDEINKLDISSEYKNIIKDKYDKIKDFLIKSGKEGVKEMNKAASSADEDTKKEVKNSLENFNNDFADKIDNQIIVIMNGRRIDEKNIKAETSSNESKISSLHDYIINEALDKDTISHYIEILNDFITVICKAYNTNNIRNINVDNLPDKLKDYYNENIKKFIDNLDKIQKTLDDNNIKWAEVDDKLSLDFGDQEPNKEILHKLANVLHIDKVAPGGITDIEKLKEEFKKLKNTAEQIDNSEITLFNKLFSGETLSDDESKKISEYLKDKFNNLSEDDIKEIISKISELSNKVKDENVSEGFINESATSKDLLDNIKSLREYLLQKALKVNKNIKNDKNTNKNSFSGTVSALLNTIFSTNEKKKQQYDPKSDKISNKDKILSGAEVDLVAGFFANYVFNDMDNSLDNLKKAFTGIIELKEWLVKNDEIKDKAKNLYAYIISLFKKSERFENDINKGRFTVYDFELPDDKKTEFNNKLDNQISDTSQEELNKELEQAVKDNKYSNNTNDDNLLSIYKVIIKSFSKDNKFKDAIKNNEYELLDGVSIEESYKTIYSLKDYLLFEKLEKKDFKVNLEKLKNYLVKLFSKIKKSENGEKHEVTAIPVTDIVKSMGADYLPSTVSKSDNVITALVPSGEQIKQLPTIPDKSDNTNNDSNNDSNDNEGNDELTGEIVPVLMFANDYIVDLAPANKDGVRDDLFTVKGMNKDYEFFTVTGGFSIKEIQDLLGEYLHAMTSNLIEFVITKPNEIKKNWWKDKIIVNPNVDPDDERDEFGKLTNSEIVDILNNPKNASKYISAKTGKLTDNEKETIEKNTKENTEKLKNKINDDEVKDAIKEIDPEVVKDDGTVDDNKLKKVSALLANWQLQNYYNNRKSKKKGLWARIKSFFGFGDDDNNKYSRLNSLIGESLSIYNDKTIGYKSLTDYLKENLD